MIARTKAVTSCETHRSLQVHLSVLQERDSVPRKDHERVRLSPTRLMSPEPSLLVHTPRHVLHIGIMEIECAGGNMGYKQVADSS
jgi:hypothetical protein